MKSKAEAALRRYRTHAVVGNILETRYKEVTLVSQGETKVLRPLDAGIDDVLVRELVRRHAEFLDYAASCSDDVDKDCS